MSSHHIIREKQEPALLISDIGTFDTEYLGQLLEWSPTIIVNSIVYEHIYSLGIKIDVVIGSPETSFPPQEHIRYISATEEDFLQTSLDFLVREEYPSVNIISEAFNVNDYKNFVNLIDIVVFTDNQKIFPIKTGFSKWKPGGENIYIMSPDARISSFNGLKKLDNTHFITHPDGFYSFNFSNDHIFIAEKI